MQIKAVESADEARQLDELLWEVSVEAGRPSAKYLRILRVRRGANSNRCSENARVIGGLVAYWVSGTEIELRHIAVAPEHQKKAVGTALVKALVAAGTKEGPVKILTVVWNTSMGFFEKLGFTDVGDGWIDHPEFTKQGIRFSRMQLILSNP